MGTIIMKIKETMRNQHINLAAITALLMPLLILLQPHNAVGAPITCSSGVSGCHFKPTVKDGTARNVPDGLFTGSHARHSGYSTSSTKRQYMYACTVCHPSSGYTNAHQSGFKNITGSGLSRTSYTGGNKIANTDSPAFGSCNNNFCHSTGQATNGTATPVYKPVTWGGTANCGGCHLDMDTDPTAPGDHVVHAQTYPFACADCHNGYTEATVTTSSHVNKTINTSFSGTLASGTTYSQANQPAGNGFGTCSTSYCHSSGQSSTGGATPTYPATPPTWGVTTTNCGSCHVDMDSSPSATGNHLMHAQTKAIACATCHKNYTETAANAATHVNKTIELDFTGSLISTGTAYSGGTTPGNHAVGGGYGTCSTSYCHSTVQLANGTAGAPNYMTPTWGGGSLGCTGCHGNTSATLTTGSHATHLLTTTHATYNCANCHNGYEAGATADHVNKVINVQQNAILGSTGTYTDAAGAPGNGYGSCGTSYCHSNVQSATGGPRVAGDYKTVAWGAASPGCAGCHGNTSATLLTGTHAKHLNGYGYTCADCHGTTGGAGNTTIHANQAINIDLTNKGTTATYSGDGTPANSNFGTCSATICHGRNSGTWGSSVSNQLCTECHGQANTAYPNFSSSIIAPGGAGVDTGGNTAANSSRVGAHQTHLLASSGISDKIHCGECHTVHVAINEGTHLNYTTSTITFGPLAKTQSHTTAGVTRVSGNINCSNTYCHTAKTNTGTGLTPVWNDTAYLTATTNLVMADCKKCHNMPPANGDHTGIANLSAFPAATCNCHTTMSGTATTVAAIFTDKTKHVNGIVDASVDCLGCHKGTQGVRQAVVGATLGSTGDDFVRPSRHIKNTTVKNVDCIICHAEGSTASTETSVARVAEHTNGTVKLRNVDSQANPGTAGNNFWNWPGRRNGGTTITSGDRDNMDRFCVNCHDSDGALTIAVNSAGTGIDTGASVTRRLTPFNPSDGGTPLNVKSQFNSGNAVGKNYASHHNLNIYTKRYTAAYASTYATRGGWTGTSKDGVAMTWDTGLHCSDCHLNESNAHGARLATRMLQDKNGADAVATNSGDGTGTFVCYRCHTSTVYNAGNPTTGKARIEHDSFDTAYPFTAGSYGDRGIVCLNCHSGGGLGGIHGNNRSITTVTQGATKSYRFMYGNELGLDISEANWETTTQPSCYTSGSTWGGSCTKHNPPSTSNARIGAPTYSRPLQ